MRTLLPLLALLGCSENMVLVIEEPSSGGDTASVDSDSPEQVPAADSSLPEPVDTSPPVDTAPPEPEPLRESCLEILRDGLSVGDGEYEIDPPCSDPITVVCDMTTDGGGWTRISSLDFATDACPGDWQPEAELPICSRQASEDSQRIRSASFEAWCIPHTALRGQFVSYQYGSTDGFGDTPADHIDETYGDVISVTVDRPEATEHAFTYGVGFKSGGSDDSNCPDIDGGAEPPDFVGSDYLCETGNLSSSSPDRVWFSDVPLFDDAHFQVDLSAESTEPVDVRLIATHTTDDEDVGVGSVELWVR